MNGTTKIGFSFGLIAVLAAACGGNQTGDLGSDETSGGEPTGSLQFALATGDCNNLLGAKVRGAHSATRGGWPFKSISLKVYEEGDEADTRGDEAASPVTLTRAQVAGICNGTGSTFSLYTFRLQPGRYQVVGEIKNNTGETMNVVSDATKWIDVRSAASNSVSLDFTQPSGESTRDLSITATVGAWSSGGTSGRTGASTRSESAR